MRNAADNADVVVPVGWQFYNVSEVADEYPDVKFIWVDNEVENVEDHPNILCIKYAQNEGSFLAGYIAAKMSTSVLSELLAAKTALSTTLLLATSRVRNTQILMSMLL